MLGLNGKAAAIARSAANALSKYEESVRGKPKTASAIIGLIGTLAGLLLALYPQVASVAAAICHVLPVPP